MLFEFMRQGTHNIPRKLYNKFHQDPTSGISSRFHLSSKSLPVVLEDVDVLDEVGDGLQIPKIFLGTLKESFIKIQLPELCY